METKIKTAIINSCRQIHRNYDQISKEALKLQKKGPATHECKYCKSWVYSGKKSPEKLDMDVPEGIELVFMKIKIDHIRAINGVDGFQDWIQFIGGLFCDIENYAACCDECHKKKTKIETSLRAKYRKYKKDGKDVQEVIDEWNEHVDKYKNL